MNEHEEAVRAATRRYQRTEQAHKQARTDAIAAVLAALRAGERPTDVQEWSPFTATYVRKLARKAEIPAPDHPRRRSAG